MYVVNIESGYGPVVHRDDCFGRIKHPVAEVSAAEVHAMDVVRSMQERLGILPDEHRRYVVPARCAHCFPARAAA